MTLQQQLPEMDQCVRKNRLQMIDSSSIRVHQHAAIGQKKKSDPFAWVARAAV